MLSICLSADEPALDTLPVFKTTFYPWAGEEDSFRPLAYARAAFVKDRGFLVDLQAFEREPERGARELRDDSCLALAFSFFPEKNDDILCLIANREARSELYLNGELTLERPKLNTYAGEDEQGWYWGLRFYLDCALLQKLCGSCKIEAGQRLRGNFYKFLRAGSCAHLATVCPVSGGGIILGEKDLGDFCAAAY
ncbi:MAG: hypothetical protein Q4B42_06150 [Oscillospiraceae bacterium]|nr:hypothetical protein [Oscillospiraceae bacterium]